MGAEKRLRDRQCLTAVAREKTYRLNDGGGLFLQIRPDGTKEGAKYWQYRYRHDKKEKLCQIGPYPEISLEDARFKLIGLRAWVRDGKDPVMERRLQKARTTADAGLTLEAVGNDWLAYHRPGWSATHYERNEGLLRRIVYPAIGGLPVDQVPAATLLQALREAEKRGTLESARRARSIASQVFSWAIATQRAKFNPARELTKAFRTPEVKHFAALPKEQLGDFLRKLEADKTLEPTVKAALRLMLLTGLRDHELRAARWQEFDFDAGVWRVPAERMKRREPHTVPLPSQAYAILTELHALTFNGPASFVFASERAKAGYLAENTLRLALHRLGFKVTAHGLRSLLTDTLNELGFRHDWIERQLHHAEGNKVTAAYKRTDFLEQRKGMMQSWADYCDQRQEGKTHDEAAGVQANVIPLLLRQEAA